jgi:hypothetical protein
VPDARKKKRRGNERTVSDGLVIRYIQLRGEEKQIIAFVVTLLLVPVTPPRLSTFTCEFFPVLPSPFCPKHPQRWRWAQ